MSEPKPRISATALANLFRDHRASNEWNAAVVFYLSGYEDLAARVAELECELRLIEGHSHPGYVIGQHWLSSAYERICAGESELDVMQDYGYSLADSERQS